VSRYRQGLAAVGAEDRTWEFAPFVQQTNKDHDRLAALWPTVRALATRLSDDEKIAWNALVYVQQATELQLVAVLQRQPGATRTDYAGLGVFAGLPGGGVAHNPADSRFAVAKLNVSGHPSVGFPPAIAAIMLAPTAIKIGAFVVAGIVGLAALLAVLKVTGVTDMVERHWTAVGQYETYVNAMVKAGQIPIAPPKPPAAPFGLGTGLALGAGAVAAAVLLPRLLRAA